VTLHVFPALYTECPNPFKKEAENFY